jgi:hypothetical protein
VQREGKRREDRKLAQPKTKFPASRPGFTSIRRAPQAASSTTAAAASPSDRHWSRRLRSLPPWHRSADSLRASIRDLSRSVSPRGSRGRGRQPEVKMASGPTPRRPLPIALPQVERWPAQIQTRKRRQVPLENHRSALRQTCSANADGWNGLQAQTSPLQQRGRGMENFLLFILSSSVCTLVASVTLLLRPLVGLP